jgi:ferredoxin-nitrate reductase
MSSLEVCGLLLPISLYNTKQATENWDPISKQPMFKSGAISIKKCEVKANGKADLKTKAPMRTAVQKVSTEKPDAAAVGHQKVERHRHLELWLGATIEGFRILLDAFDNVIPKHAGDPEIMKGLQECHRIVDEIAQTLEPMCEKYGKSLDFGKDMSRTVLAAVLPIHDDEHNAYEALTTLSGTFTFLAYLDSHLIALVPASQALWDEEFVKAVAEAKSGVDRLKAWVQQELVVKSPQTLIVPSLVKREDVRGMTQKSG